MAKTEISQFDLVPANNTDIGNIGIRGTDSVQNFDDALRTLMSYLKADYSKTSAFMRTLLDDADAAAARVTLGVAPSDLKIAWEKIASNTFSGAPIIEVTIPSTDFRLVDVAFDGVQLSANAQIVMQLQFAGVWATSGYVYFGTYSSAGTAQFNIGTQTSAANISLSSALISTALPIARFAADIVITAPATSGIKSVRFNSSGIRAADSSFEVSTGMGENSVGTGPITGIRLMASAGVFTAGRYLVMGAL